MRLGAQFYESDVEVTDRDHARSPLPRSLGPGASLDAQFDVPMPVATGRYALKFDLVSEGVDWVEACGPETTTTPLWVVA